MQAVKNNKCFMVWSNELDNRLDPYYHKTEFAEIINKIEKGEFKTKTIGELSELVKSGSTPKASLKCFTRADGILFIRNTDLKENVIRYSLAKKIKREFENNLKGLLLKKGDVLISMAGTIGISAIYDMNDLATINQNITLIRFNKEINPQYAVIWLNTYYFKRLIDRVATIATIKYVNNEVIKKLPIPVPPLATQNEIVKLIKSAYDKKIDKEQKAENILNSIDDYILEELEIKMPEAQDKECFSINSKEVDRGRLDCYYYQPKFKQGEKSLKKASCKTDPLKNYITKIHYGASLKNDYVDEGIPLLRIQNLKPNKLVLDNIVKISEARRKELGNAFVSKGDLLISRSGSVGIVSVVPKEAEGFAFGSFMIKFCLNDKIDKDFVSIWLNNKIPQLFIKREKIGAIQGNITIETIENLQILTPPIETQKKLVREVKERIAKVNKLNLEAKNEIEKAKQEVEKIILGK